MIDGHFSFINNKVMFTGINLTFFLFIQKPKNSFFPVKNKIYKYYKYYEFKEFYKFLNEGVQIIHF